MSHRGDYIPTKDEAFDAWQHQFNAYLALNNVAWGIPALNPDYVDLLAKQADWVAKFSVGKKSAMPNHPQVVAKQTSRHGYEKAIRLFNKRYIMSNGSVTDSDRSAMSVTIVDTVRTRSQVPDYAPSVTVHKIEHELHVLRILDPSHPDSREMADGAVGVLLFGSTAAPLAGPPPIPDMSTFYFLGTAHTFDFEVTWPNSLMGKTAYYYAHYVDIHGAIGPDCPVFSAVIA